MNDPKPRSIQEILDGLTPADRQTLQEWLLTRATRPPVPAEDSTLDPRIRRLMAGAIVVKASKLLNLPTADVDRLLSDEQFEVYDNVAMVHTTTWARMNASERNRLIGRKGMKILPLSEQTPPQPRAFRGTSNRRS